jgi:hypothetical protein
MTGKDLFGTLVRWTALIWILGSLSSFFVLHWFDLVLMIVAAIGLLTFADDVVEFSYQKRPSLFHYFRQRTDHNEEPPQ